jgi:hypothetical protein|tara:strand:- start:461 stop:715 length:255 start_codon:yes stop_codon:yes gene_type:complete
MLIKHANDSEHANFHGKRADKLTRDLKNEPLSGRLEAEFIMCRLQPPGSASGSQVACLDARAGYRVEIDASRSVATSGRRRGPN